MKPQHKQKSCACFYTLGRRCNINLSEVLSVFSSALEFIQKDLHYHYIDMEHLDVGTKEELYTLMADGIKLGTIKPLEAKVFSHKDLTAAFKFKAKNLNDSVVIQVFIFC